MEKRYGALSSSADPQKLSATVSGVILAIGTVLLAVAQGFGVPLLESDISTLATQLGGAASSLAIAYGTVRKIVLAVNNRFSA